MASYRIFKPFYNQQLIKILNNHFPVSKEYNFYTDNDRSGLGSHTVQLSGENVLTITLKEDEVVLDVFQPYDVSANAFEAEIKDAIGYQSTKEQQFQQLKSLVTESIHNSLSLEKLYVLYDGKVYTEISDQDFADIINDVIADLSGNIQSQIYVMENLIKIQDRMEIKPTNVDTTKLNIEGIKAWIKKLEKF